MSDWLWLMSIKNIRNRNAYETLMERLKRFYNWNLVWMKRLYIWLFRIQAPYEQYRVKAIIKVGKKKFKVRAHNYEEFLKIIINSKEGRKNEVK